MTDLRSAEQRLDALRQRFTVSLAARLEAIEAALGGDGIELERLFHSLAGTAGTYGFHALTEIARRGEEHFNDPVVARQSLAELRMAVSLLPKSTATPPEAVTAVAPQQPAGRILCLEDDPDQAAFVGEILRGANYETAIAHDVAQFADVVQRFRPDLLLLDVSLPDGCGLDLATAIRRAGKGAALPIVFLTGRASPRARLEGIRAGADDYLTKPVDRDLLLATVAARLERAQTVRTLIERDGLTEAATHATFLENMRTAVHDHERTGMPYCLVMLDLDHFKNINDSYGHPIGDRVLSLFARFLRANVRVEDVVGRCGGEEFGILLSGILQEDASLLIARLLDRFARIPHAARSDERFYVTFSAGVAAIEPGEQPDAWRQRADDALYGAKRAGRNRVAAA